MVISTTSEVEVVFLAAIREGDEVAVRRQIEQDDANANMILTVTKEELYQFSTRRGGRVGSVAVPVLYVATAFGKANVVEVLLEKKADINAVRGEIRETPLPIALECSFFQVADALLQHGADANLPNLYNTLPLELCCCATHAHFIPTLLRYGACIQGSKNAWQTPLLVACTNGDLQSASILVEHGADVNSIDRHGRSPIFSVTKNPDIIRLLIVNGAQVNLQDNNGWTPLHFVGVNAECFALLLSSNVNIDVQSRCGSTPLQCAVYDDRFDVARVLLTHQRSRHGQDGVCSLLLICAHGWSCQNVLHFARTARTARLLVEQCRCKDGILRAACHQLMSTKDTLGKTPLERARRNIRADVVEYLESFGKSTLATSEASSLANSVAVMLNPRLDDFQRAIATDCLELIRSNCLDIPDAALYVMLGYLSPSDAMKR